MKNGYPTKPVTVTSAADETEALPDGSSAHVCLRIGSVASHIFTSETGAKDLEYAAKIQVGRVREVAAGKNPDRRPRAFPAPAREAPPVTCVSAVHRGCLSWSLGESNP
ncbi:hypothetical protein ACIO8G_21110 [Streptomyces sp. NPDC087219]|uniref:hypothetical protein n=1 Tax=unclassified Streptomyces TaxID=2593676 RepID=UPI0037FE69F4